MNQRSRQSQPLLQATGKRGRPVLPMALKVAHERTNRWVAADLNLLEPLAAALADRAAREAEYPWPARRKQSLFWKLLRPLMVR